MGSREVLVCAMFLKKKSRFVTAASHGFSLEARVSGGPAALPRRSLPVEAPSAGSQAPSLRLSLSISLYLSLFLSPERLSSLVSEALSESLALP